MPADDLEANLLEASACCGVEVELTCDLIHHLRGREAAVQVCPGPFLELARPGGIRNSSCSGSCWSRTRSRPVPMSNADFAGLEACETRRSIPRTPRKGWTIAGAPADRPAGRGWDSKGTPPPLRSRSASIVPLLEQGRAEGPHLLYHTGSLAERKLGHADVGRPVHIIVDRRQPVAGAIARVGRAQVVFGAG